MMRPLQVNIAARRGIFGTVPWFFSGGGRGEEEAGGVEKRVENLKILSGKSAIIRPQQQVCL